MSKRKCGLCGKDPAEGFASTWTRNTGEVFYCHGDDEPVPCYEGASWATTGSELSEVMFPALADRWATERALRDLEAEFGVDLDGDLA